MIHFTQYSRRNTYMERFSLLIGILKFLLIADFYNRPTDAGGLKSNISAELVDIFTSNLVRMTYLSRGVSIHKGVFPPPGFDTFIICVPCKMIAWKKKKRHSFCFLSAPFHSGVVLFLLFVLNCFIYLFLYMNKINKSKSNQTKPNLSPGAFEGVWMRRAIRLPCVRFGQDSSRENVDFQ